MVQKSMTTGSKSISIKGIKEGLLITMSDGEWHEISQEFLNLIDENLEFFAGARIAIDVGSHILKAVDLGILRDNISERGLTLWAVLSTSPTTEVTAQTLGLATRLSKPLPYHSRNHKSDIPETSNALLVQKTIRSGQKISFDGHVIIIGDVNPGAEICASGNILVWGKLRGTVHAGVEGNTNAIIGAIELTPTQLRIGDKISILPQPKSKPRPEVALVVDGRIYIRAWNQYQQENT